MAHTTKPEDAYHRRLAQALDARLPRDPADQLDWLNEFATAEEEAAWDAFCAKYRDGGKNMT